ncbi:MAG: TrmB family transcriptional regulator [Candidatus Hermodarchaeota archaeon]
MNDETRIINLLKTLGLNSYEARVFLELFRKSPQIARSLSKASDVSRGRIYQVLNELNNKGLVIEKSIRGASNLYEISSFPECLEKLKNAKRKELLQEIEVLNSNYVELKNLLLAFDRELPSEAEVLDTHEMVVIRGETAHNYYIKKIIDEADSHILTNFTSDLILKHKSIFTRMQDVPIRRTFVMPESELSMVEEIIKGAEIYVLNLEELPSPLLIALKDVRPSMLIADDKIAIVFFHKQSDSALLIQSPELLKYQAFLLSLFIQAAEKKE